MRTSHLWLAQLDELNEKVTQMLELYQDKIRYDAQKEKAFETLYEELAMYKNNFVEQSLLGVYKDLILLYDNVVRCLRSSPVKTRRVPAVQSLLSLYLSRFWKSCTGAALI